MSHITTFLAGDMLRWVTRLEDTQEAGGSPQAVKVRVLQQGLRPVNGGPVQWFDVPEVDEVPL